MLQLILVLLVAGVLVISFAGQITRLDLVAGDATTSLDQERSNIDDRQTAVSVDLAVLRQDQIALIGVLEAVGIQAKLGVEGSVDIENSSYLEFLGRLSSPDQPIDARALVLPLPSFEIFRTTGRVILSEEFGTANLAIASTGDSPAQAQTGGSSDAFDSSTLTEAEVVQYARRFLQATIAEMRSNNQAIFAAIEDLNAIASRQKALEDISDTAYAKQLTAQASPADQNSSFLIASGITRFGIVAIIVYIMQILVSLYRYNMRLSAFYGSRLKAIVVSPPRRQSLENLAKLFDTGEIAFGRDVNSPTQDVKEVIQSSIDAAGKAWVARGGG